MAIECPDTQTAELEIIFRRFLEIVGEDPNREGLRDTPLRAAKAWQELLCGYHQEPSEIMRTFGDDVPDQMIVVRNVQVYAVCEHHLLPFSGVAHVGYIPGERIIGVSKIARLVRLYARRLQIQERLTEQVMQTLVEHLQPAGVMVIVKAQHLCMQMRGVNEPNGEMVTSAVYGAFRDNPEARAEFMAMIG